MRLYSPSLPKLALFVNVVCLLLALLLESVHCLILNNKCSGKNLAVNRSGNVYSGDDLQNYQNFTLKPSAFNKFYIYAMESQRFLCWDDHYRLCGLEVFNKSRCQFYIDTSSQNGYCRFILARGEKDPDPRYIRFKKNGTPTKAIRSSRLKPRMKECTEFIHSDMANVDDHNKKLASQDADVPQSQNIKSYSPSHSSHSLKSSRRAKIRHKNHHHPKFNDIT